MFFKKKDQDQEIEEKETTALKPLVSNGPKAVTVTVSPVKVAPVAVSPASTAVASAPVAPATENPPSLAAASRENQADIIAERFGKIRSALGPGTVIQGKLSFDTPVSIDGKLSGEVYSTKALIVGKQGVIDAKLLEVATLVVLGTVKGSIKASEGIELIKGGKIIGDITTPRLLIEEGAMLDGSCAMPETVTMTSVLQPKQSENKPLDNKLPQKGKTDTPAKQDGTKPDSSKPENGAGVVLHVSN